MLKFVDSTLYRPLPTPQRSSVVREFSRARRTHFTLGREIMSARNLFLTTDERWGVDPCLRYGAWYDKIDPPNI
jgi:hypothetical protein